MTRSELVEFAGNEGAAGMLMRHFPQWSEMTRSDFERIALAVVISAASRRDAREEMREECMRLVRRR
jgi:hypothetical protein